MEINAENLKKITNKNSGKRFERILEKCNDFAEEGLNKAIFNIKWFEGTDYEEELRELGFDIDKTEYNIEISW